MRQLVYTALISNNRPTFHLWWKENLAKLQQVSKYYEKDCLQIFLFLFMSLLPTKFVKNSHIWSKIYFIFLKNVLKQTRNSFNTKFQAQWKACSSSYQLKQILAVFCDLIPLILGQSSVEVLGVTEIVKEIKFEEVLGKLKSKKRFQRILLTKNQRLTLVSMWNNGLREKFHFCFPRVFC